MTFVWRGCTIFCVERLHDLTHSLTQVRLHDFLCVGFVFFFVERLHDFIVERLHAFLWRGISIFFGGGCMIFLTH